MAKDITKRGIGPISGLRFDPNSTPEERAALDSEMSSYVQARKLRQKGVNTSYVAPISSMSEPEHYQPGTPGYERGLSKYDKTGDLLTPYNSFQELNQHRYDEQPWYDVLANGIVKTVGRTATSFIDSMVGGIFGIGTAIVEGRLSGLWDNPLSNAMADVDDWFSDNFVNYQSLTQQQNSRNGEWWNNLDSLNMWMDDILTNTGFTLGMMAASMTGAGLLGAASKAMKGVGLVSKYGKQATKAITLLNSTSGEAAVEALGAKREYAQAETQRINDNIDSAIASDADIQQLDQAYQQQSAILDNAFGYDRSSPEYQQYKQQLDDAYQQKRGQLTAKYEQHRQESMEQMNQEADQLGLAVGLGNMAILGISNFNLAGRFIDKAYTKAAGNATKGFFRRGAQVNARNAFGQSNLTGNMTEGYGSRSFLGNYGKRVGSTMLSEGVYEEMGQGALSTGAKSYYAYEDPDNYWRARLDPDSVDRTADGSHDFLRAVGNGLKETYGSAEGWKEGFIGGITGMLFGASEMRDEWRDTRYAKESAKNLNNALAGPKLSSQLQHLVAQSFHNANKEQLAADGNQSDWKTEDDKGLFALISTFAKAGKMDDMHELIRQHTEDMSDEDIDDLIDRSSRKVTAEEQREQERQRLRQEAQNSISNILKEGATVEGFNQQREAVAAAQQEEQQTRQEAASILGDVATDPRKANDLANIARRGRGEKKRAARDILDAMSDRLLEEEKLDRMLKDGSTIEDINAINDSLDRSINDVNNSEPEDVFTGPFIDDNGNRMQRDQVREVVKHNTDRMNEAVQAYQTAVEEVNRMTGGRFNKDQEDYLAYTHFLDKTHNTRGKDIVGKWRSKLGDEFRISVPKGNVAKAAQLLGIPESAIREDPEHEGYAIINTKDMSDEEYADIMTKGVLGHRHLTKVDAEGNVLDESTARFRKELRNAALEDIYDRMKKQGREQEFNRDDFTRDMEDAQKAFEKSHEFDKAYWKALNDPDSMLSAKDKALKWFKRKWNKARVRMRQAKMSEEELADLDEDQMRELDDYHYAVASMAKLKRAISEFWDGKLPSLYEQIENAFENIKDPELRQELISRVQDKLNEFVDRMKKNSGEVNAEDAEDDISALFDIDEILPDDDPLWNRISEETKKSLNKAFATLKRITGRMNKLVMMHNTIVENLKKGFDKLRNLASDTLGKIDVNSTIDSIRTAVVGMLKSKLTEEQANKLSEYAGIISEKIAQLKEKASPGYKAAVGALQKLLKTIEKHIADYRSSKKQDTEPSEASTPVRESKAKSPKKGHRNANPQDDVAETEQTKHLQNPSEETEETAMAMHEDIDTGALVTNDIWQSVTGESARRSSFTYKPYHQIVEEALKEWEKEHPTASNASSIVTTKERLSQVLSAAKIGFELIKDRIDARGNEHLDTEIIINGKKQSIRDFVEHAIQLLSDPRSVEKGSWRTIDFPGGENEFGHPIDKSIPVKPLDVIDSASLAKQIGPLVTGLSTIQAHFESVSPGILDVEASRVRKTKVRDLLAQTIEQLNVSINGDTSGNYYQDISSLFPTSNVDETKETLHIDLLGDKGNDKTIAKWREYAKRSKIVHERLTKAGAFSYIDSGKVKRDDKIGFKLAKVDGIFIVYLTHNGNIIGDLNDPAYGAEDTTGLAELYDKLKEEYGTSTGEVDSKYETTAANVYAGFIHYAEKGKDGIPTRTIESFGDAAKGMEFFVAGRTAPSQDLRDIIGKGVVGQPFVLIPAPANDGLTRRHAVPVKTMPIKNDGVEMEVIKTVLNSDMSMERKIAFLNNFLNCKRCFIKETDTKVFKDLALPGAEEEQALELSVVLRSQHNGKEMVATIYVTPNGNVSVFGADELRANVSFNLLNPTQSVPSYESIAKLNPALPKSYNDFLKKVCHTHLSDPRVHNSWITINKLEFDKDGNPKIVKDPEQEHTAFTRTGEATVMVRDPRLGESYRVTVSNNGINGTVGIIKVEVSRNGQPFNVETMSEGTRDRMLPVLAQAVTKVTGWQLGKTRRFSVAGVVYEFATHEKTVGAVTVAADEAQINKDSLDRLLFNAMKDVAKQYDGTEEALDNIIKTWFISGTVAKDSAEYQALKGLLDAMKKRKRSFDGIPPLVKVNLLNMKKPMSEEQKQKTSLARALINQLEMTAGKRFRINTDWAEGQRILNEWKKGKRRKDIKMFVKDGGTVYGFAYKGTIYVDLDIIKPETLIHEYAHLWAALLRDGNQRQKDMWQKLVTELKDNPMWGIIKSSKKYEHLTTDDEIADEVFAQLSGKDGEKWLASLVEAAREKGDTDEDALAKAVQSLRNAFQKFIDYIKSALLNIKPEAKTVNEMLQQMVWNDMLSDNPLSNFDQVFEESTAEEQPAEEQNAEELKGMRVSDYSYEGGSVEDMIAVIEGVGGEINPDNNDYFTLPEGISPEDLGMTKNTEIKAHIEVEEFEQQAQNDNLAVMLSNGRFEHPAYVSASEFINQLEFSRTRNHMNMDAFLKATELLFSEEQRDKLWEGMSEYMNTRTLPRHEIIAHMQHLFNRFMSEGSVGNETLDSLFRTLRQEVSNLCLSKEEFLSSVQQSYGMTADVATPSDVISSLSAAERRLAHSESLDLLSQQDIEYLKMAGYPEPVYHSLSDSSKEQIRKCIL